MNYTDTLSTDVCTPTRMDAARRAIFVNRPDDNSIPNPQSPILKSKLVNSWSLFALIVMPMCIAAAIAMTRVDLSSPLGISAMIQFSVRLAVGRNLFYLGRRLEHLLVRALLLRRRPGHRLCVLPTDRSSACSPDLVLVGFLQLCSTVLGRGLSDVLFESSIER